MFHNIFILDVVFSQLLKYTLLQIRNFGRAEAESFLAFCDFEYEEFLNSSQHSS